MQHILITGGSGLVGQQITELLEKKGYEVAWLSRSAQWKKTFLWNVEKGEIDPKAIEWADAIIHLAGAGVAEKRWTPERKKLILESRTQSTQLLFSAIKKSAKKPSTFSSTWRCSGTPSPRLALECSGPSRKSSRLSWHLP